MNEENALRREYTTEEEWLEDIGMNWYQ